MTVPIEVYRGRTNKLTVSLGIDVSSDVLSSEIRKEKDQESDLIATWGVSFLTDGTDGELVLTLDDSQTESIEYSNGYMDIKRVIGGEPTQMFAPIQVAFRGAVTA